MLSPLPKVRVATTIITASAVPNSADRTGTAVRPRPGSSAKRMPVTAETGAPERSTPAGLDPRSRVSTPCRARARAGTER